MATLISFSLSRTAALRDQRSFLKLGRPHANHMQTTRNLVQTLWKPHAKGGQPGVRGNGLSVGGPRLPAPPVPMHSFCCATQGSGQGANRAAYSAGSLRSERARMRPAGDRGPTGTAGETGSRSKARTSAHDAAPIRVVSLEERAPGPGEPSMAGEPGRGARGRIGIISRAVCQRKPARCPSDKRAILQTVRL